MSGSNRVIRVTTWIAASVAVVVAIIMPLGYFTAFHQHMEGQLEAEAEINSRIVTGLINANPEMWRYERLRLEELLAKRPRSGEKETWRILDIEGKVIAESASQLTPPLVMRSADLKDAGVTVGRIELSRSLIPLLARTGLIALLGLTLGAGVFTSLRVLPIRAMIRAEEQLAYQSNHDGITGLPIRNLFNDRIRQIIFFASRHRLGVAVMLIDLDHFKYINDSLGREVGDRLLKETAGRLTCCLRSIDTVARHGGDEFAVVLADLQRVEDAGQVARKINEAVSVPIRIDEHELVVSCSIGISVYPRDGGDAQTLLKNADLAMSRAKVEGRDNFQFFTEELNTGAGERITMEKHLRRALETREFLLHFQPQIDLNTGRVSGAEALLRWQSQELGFLPPGRFIPLAEETGLIVPIGEWVLKTSCAQNKAWQDAGLPRLTVAVNLSPRQFWQEDLPDLVDRALRETGLEPKYLELEIVESMLMRDPDKATDMLNRLHDLGVRLAMDDFGTGYSSLNYLKRFPLDRMKIDRSFVCDVTSDPESAAIVRTIIAMAGSMNLRVTAEGVETEGQMAFLRANGCDEMQGFYFSRPVPSGEFEQMLHENRRLEFAMESGRARDRTLLLVDDEVDVIASLKRTFYDEGYTILTACSAAEGFALLAVNRVGVIVADQRMPVMSGADFLMRVKELYPDTIRLVLTASSDIDTITEAINKGAIFKFLTKPCENDLLREHIREAFRYHDLVCGKVNRPV